MTDLAGDGAGPIRIRKQRLRRGCTYDAISVGVDRMQRNFERMADRSRRGEHSN
jgi:hypothetical protein